MLERSDNLVSIDIASYLRTSAVIKRMRWKAFYLEQNDTRNNSKNIYYDLKSDKTPPPMKLLELFEKDLFKIAEKTKF